MVKNPTRAADSPLAGHLRMLQGTVTGAEAGSNGAVFLSSGLLTAAWVEFMHMGNAAQICLSPPRPTGSGQITHISDCLASKSRSKRVQ